MASALTILFLGCWLAGRSRVSGKLIYPKPSISLRPSGGVPQGAAVTVRCRGPYQNMRFLLYKDGNPTALQDVEPAGDLAEFPIRNVNQRDAGSYRCYYRDKGHQLSWSHPSDPVELVVAEPSYPKPNISLRPSGQVALGGAVIIRCECQCQGARFLVSKAGDPDPWCTTDSKEDVAEFPIRSVNRRDAGSYSCQYSTKWDPPVWSEPSDPVELVVEGGTDPTQSGTAPTSCSCGVGPGNESKGSESPSTTPKTEGTTSAGPKQLNPTTTEPEGEGGSELKLSIPIIARVSTSAAGLLLLLVLVAFLCYRRTRRRKGPAPKQSRESEPATTVYALRGEGTQLDVLPQEPDPSAEGLTYAELDGQALQAKQGGPAPAPEPVLYATIDVS